MLLRVSCTTMAFAQVQEFGFPDPRRGLDYFPVGCAAYRSSIYPP